jgi:hypothetical protein
MRKISGVAEEILVLDSEEEICCMEFVTPSGSHVVS